MKGSDEYWFIRPSEDTKKFSGQVAKCRDIVDWLRDRVGFGGTGDYLLDPNLSCVLAKPIPLKAEYRWFIVGNQIIMNVV